MAVMVVCLVLFLAMAGHSDANYCQCKDGLSDTVYQTDIDYACGKGANCNPILLSGACYNPNTKKEHCNYAVNSYYQNMNQASGSCDFSGSCTVVSTLTSTTAGCVYPTSASPAGTIGTTPTTGTPTTGTGIGTTTPTTGGTTSTGGGTTTATPSSSIFSLGPTGSGSITNTDSKATSLTIHQTKLLFWSLTLTLLFSGPMLFRLF